ncbi:MAG: hypothetical protein M3N54_01125 [Acidobacteriota bacterium]|nr:hypothetical protein [Acidobacteriota bacterium]
MSRVLALVALMVSLVSCGGDISFPPPPQRTHAAHSVTHPVAAMLGMANGQADMPWASIVQGVEPPAPGVDWRWAHAHPAFEFNLMDYDGWKAIVRLTCVGKVLEVTGPQHVIMSVNGSVVGKITLDKAGNYDVTFPVDAAVLKSAAPIVLRLDIDPCLLSDSPSEKGAAYCVLVRSAGFLRGS